MNHTGLSVTSNAFFPLLTHTKYVLLMTYFDLTAGIEDIFFYGWTTAEGQTDVKVEIVSYLDICSI